MNCAAYSAPLDVLVARVAMLVERRRRERHELRAAEPLVQPLVHRRFLGVIQNRPVPERARAVLHAAVEARDDLAGGEQHRDLRLDRRVLGERQLRALERVGDLARSRTRVRDRRRSARRRGSGVPANSSSAAPVPQPPSPMFGWMKMPSTPAISRRRWFSLTLATTPPDSTRFLQAGLLDVLRDVRGAPLPRARAGRRRRRRSSGTGSPAAARSTRCWSRRCGSRRCSGRSGGAGCRRGLSGSPYAARPTIFPSCRLGLNPSADVTDS